MARKKQPSLEKGCYARRSQCFRVAYGLGLCLLFLFAVYVFVPLSSSTVSPTLHDASSSPSTSADWEKGPTFDVTDPVPESESTESESTPSDDSSDEEDRRLKECDIFDGKWVRDNRDPFYPAGSCPYVDMMFDCFKNERPDDGYLYWRWQPNHCNIPRMNATDFLERLRGQRLVLVGDSLNRNMFESLICILRHSVPNKKRVFEISGATNLKARPYSCVKFMDYNCSVEFIRANYLVKLNLTRGQEYYRVRLDLIEDSASIYREADILIFNTGRWWGHVKSWKNVFQEGEYLHPYLPFMDACEKGMRTWAAWVDGNINTDKTQLFYRAYSPSHFRGGLWNSGGKCHEETEPIYDEKSLKSYPEHSILAEKILSEMRSPITFLNVSRLASYRGDGHTSIYRMKYKDEKEKADAVHHQDCAHWCLPGVPDIWNELLYATLLKIGRGPWKY